MSKDTPQPDLSPELQECYELCVKDHLMPFWSEVFEGMQLTLTPCGETLITGIVADQAACMGCLQEFAISTSP